MQCNTQELVTAVNETFDLSVDASKRFYTQELAGNKGYNVEITKNVWDGVRSILTSVIVEQKGARNPEARKTPRQSIAPPQPDRVVTHEAGAAPTKEVIDAARRLSRLSLAPRDGGRRASRRSFAPRASLALSLRTDSAAPVRDGGDIVKEEDEEDEEEEVVFHSGRGLGKRQVIASEDELEDEEDEDMEDDDEDGVNEMIDDEVVEDDLRDELEEQENHEDADEDPFLSAQGGHAERGTSPAQEQPPPKTPASQTARRPSEQRKQGRPQSIPVNTILSDLGSLSDSGSAIAEGQRREGQ